MSSQKTEKAGAPAHFGALLGYRMVDSGDDFVVLELDVRQEHRNLYGTVHGGVILALLDTAGLWAGARRNGKLVPASTAGINCNFLSAAKSDLLQVRGEVVKRGRSLYFASSSAHAMPEGKLVATGQGVYSLAAHAAAREESGDTK